jgi:hypothetical protein
MRPTDATISVFPSLVPTEVRALFGDPPLLRGEEASLYNNLMDQFSALVDFSDSLYARAREGECELGTLAIGKRCQERISATGWAW